ncbi:MAG: DUF523 domain-containing protein [Bacilli bacterium]|nr:DUF523 domain-containing protein [Bacilli bacterium]
MEKVIVSACLIGENCKYNGGNNKREKIIEYLKDKEVILVCPEVMGGMSTPRLKSEIKDGKVISEKGDDVTDYFVRGATIALKKSLESGAKIAILKEKSPSCGTKFIYNGEFNGTLIKGSGVFSSLISQKGIKILTEEDF